MGYRYNAITGQLDIVDTTTVPTVYVSQVDTDAGSAIPVAHIINLLGTTAQGITTSGAGNTVTLTISDATETQKGVAELATDAESIAGANSTNIVVPTSLKAKLGVQTANALPYGTTDSVAFGWTNALTDGQMVIGSTAGNPQAGTITSTGGTISVSTGSNTLNIEAAASIPNSFVTDSGSAVPALNILNVLGGEGIDTSGVGNTLTITGEDASETNKGILELSTDTETKAGTDDATAVTPLKLVSYNNDKKFTGFLEWGGAGAYYSVVGTQLTLLRSGSGYIKGQKISWTAPQTTASLTKGNTYLVYIDNTGTIGATTLFAQATYENYIPLFEILCDNDTPSNTLVVKENHPYSAPTDLSVYLHNSIGTVISNRNNGANITLNGTDEIEISGTDYLEDHGLETTIPDSGGVGETWEFYYVDGSGKWVLNASTATFPSVYNNAGVVTALGANKYGVFRLYCSKEDLNSSTPKYIAVIDDAQYNNQALAEAAISNGNISYATNELFNLEVCQLGYVIYEESSSSIVEVIIEKATIRGSFVAINNSSANLITTDTSNFNGWLTAADTTVQTALETLDDVGLGVTPQYSVLLAGSSYAISSVGPQTNGQLIIGSTGGAPVAAAPTNGSNISWTLGAGTLEADLTGTTDHAIQVGNATGSLTSLGVLTNGQLPIGSTGADPVPASLTQPAAGITITGGAGTITFALADDLAGIEALATTGLVSRTAADTYAATSVTQHAVLIGDAGELPTNLGPLTDGQLIIGSTGNAPQAATLTAGTGVSITNAAGSVTINAIGGGFTWSVETLATNMVANHGYIGNNAAGVTFTLPATASVGDVFKVTGLQASWTIAQNAGQTIYFGNQSTTTGAGGSLTSTNARDVIELVCVVANNDFQVLSSIGNITVV